MFVEIEPDRAQVSAFLKQALGEEGVKLGTHLELKKLIVNQREGSWQFQLSKKTVNSQQEIKTLLSQLEAYLLAKVPSLTRVNWELEDEEAAYQKLIAKKRREWEAASPPVAPPKRSFGKGTISGEPEPIKTLTEPGPALIAGRVLRVEQRQIRGGNQLLIWDIYDGTDSITCKVFLRRNQDPFELEKDHYVMVEGNLEFDRYTDELTLMAEAVRPYQAPPEREDHAPEKRIELHLHTKMSAMDSVLDVKAAVAQAAAWGHPAIAITDHGVVQSFPDAYAAGQKHGIDVIFGLEAYLVDDLKEVTASSPDPFLEREFVVFDLETTGLSPVKDQIIELGAVRINARGEQLGELGTFVALKGNLNPRITKLTGITTQMLEGAPELGKVIADFAQFAEGAILVAHNAKFDMGFLGQAFRKLQRSFPNYEVLDTLTLSRTLCPELRNHKLDTMANHFGVSLEAHHRASDDAKATAGIFAKLLALAEARGCETVFDLGQLRSDEEWKKQRPYHALLLVQNQQGMENLYRLVSSSHLNYFYRRPRILKSQLNRYREGLLLGSACESGELFRAVLEGGEPERLQKIASYYDFLEIQPLGNNEFLLREGQVNSREELMELNETIYRLGKTMDKPVVATGDVHFLQPEDAVFREILQNHQDYADAFQQAPLFLRTTEEMLAEFDYLGEGAEEVVIAAPQKIHSLIEEGIMPVPKGLYAPKIDGAEEEIKNATYATAHKLYGDPLPPLVAERIEKELASIISNGYAVLYLIAQKLVDKSLSDGYLVGSRGSVGSSLVATMTGITEVNPLPAHYRCPDCQYSEFFTDGTVGAGADLPAKTCPQCGAELAKDGHDIPFEVFMGFHGDKIPDIDLNFSGEYQPVVHKYTEELFGEGYVYRAGTISTLAERTAYGMVKKFEEKRGLKLRSAEIQRLIGGCSGVKRTTGQHPGGVMVVPRDRSIYQFTPLHYPANDRKRPITTHFDYNAISDQLVKLDILGHDDPTVLRMLQDLTGVNPVEIPLDEPKTMSLFSSLESLGIEPDDAGGSQVGTLGIPEFGTRFVRQMLEDVRPKTFSELVRISGFSHGTDVWLNNAQDLIKEGIAEANQCVSTRDDIMSFLIYSGMNPGAAFKIMEQVRKGRGLSPEDEELMREHKIPTWFIDSCKKISYLFPKAHAVAYVTMAYRVAFCKVYHPTAFYATYFAVRAREDFDIEPVLEGKEAMKRQVAELNSKGNDLTQKERDRVSFLELAIEAKARGVDFLPVSLYESHPTNFKIVSDSTLLPPLSALDGLGAAAAKGIVSARADGEFKSVEDLRQRAGVSKKVIEVLRGQGAFAGMPESNQLSLFEMVN